MSTGPLRRAALAVVIAGAIMLGLNMGLRQTFGLFLGPMTADLGVSHSGFGLAIAIQNLLWGALTPLFGAVADRWGTGRVLVFGALTYVAGLLVMALVQTPLGMHLGAGVLVGIAVSASGFPLVLAAVARAVPEDRRSTWLGLAAAGGSLGQFALLPATQGMIVGFGWSGAVLGLAALAVLMLPLAVPLRGRPQGDGAGDQRLGEALTEAGSHRSYLLLTAGFFVCGFHVALVATHLPAYISAQGLASWVGATALGLIGFFNIFGTFGAGWLGGRFARKRVLTGIYLARAGVIATMLLLPMSAAMVLGVGAAIGLLWLGTVPLTSGLVGLMFGPRYMATLFGVVMFSHQVGAFLGAWLGGLSYDLTGSYNAVWWLAVALALGSAALHWPIRERPVARLAPEGPAAI
ncbi:MAG: MFS transporter [Halofilum sp. (in: g-proteobacteria)]|nr:MFS transporter [Halofilum sp. (in: g-proteobacteria)]